LSPIALFHFHRSGLYGAVANIVAIPLTTFVIMPLEGMALAFDELGLGAPFWWLTGLALRFLLWIAHAVADAPGSVASLPSMPAGRVRADDRRRFARAPVVLADPEDDGGEGSKGVIEHGLLDVDYTDRPNGCVPPSSSQSPPLRDRRSAARSASNQ
jgi:hypothetical protein